MATEVLLPQDMLADHSASFHRRRVFPADFPNRKQYRKTSPPDKKRSRATHHHHHGVPDPTRRPDAVQVTLLRRGESLSSISDLSVPKQIRMAPADIYAGSAFYMSPSPRSVPLPSFFSKIDTNDGASRDLRRLLRLE